MIPTGKNGRKDHVISNFVEKTDAKITFIPTSDELIPVKLRETDAKITFLVTNLVV